MPPAKKPKKPKKPTASSQTVEDLLGTNRLVMEHQSAAGQQFLKELFEKYEVCPVTAVARAEFVATRDTSSVLTVFSAYETAIDLNPEIELKLRGDMANAIRQMNASSHVAHNLFLFVALDRAVNAGCNLQQHRAEALASVQRKCTFPLGGQGYTMDCFITTLPYLQNVFLTGGTARTLKSELVTAIERGDANGIKTLSLANCSNLQDFEPLMHMSNLTTLFLDGLSKTIMDVPLEISNLPLTDLHMVSSNILYLGYVQNMQTLELLSLKDCSMFCVLPKSVLGMPNLKTLILSGTGIKEITVPPTGSTSLHTLDCSNCRLLRRLPSNIEQLRSLKVLKIQDCSNLSRIPRNVGYLELTCFTYDRCPLLRHWIAGKLASVGVIPSQGADLLWAMRLFLPAPKVLALILIARRRRQRHLPDEIWNIVLSEYDDYDDDDN